MVGREERLSRTFVELADTLVGDYEVLDFLYLLCDRCVEVLDVTSAGVLLTDDTGQLRLAAASDERVRTMKLFELQQAEGPCLEAYRSGEQIVVDDLIGTEDRWPSFTPRVLESGYRAVYSFPLRLRDDRIGGIGMLREEPAALTDADLRAAQALADVAAIGILQERKINQAEVRAAQLQFALTSRVAIEQAKGRIAERLGVDVDVAFELLRRHTRSNRKRLQDNARDLLDGTVDIEELLAGLDRQQTA